MTYYSVQGNKGVVESSRIAGQPAHIWLKDMDESIDEAKWRPLEEFSDYLPDRYKNATQDQKTAGHGGGDFFIVEDFIKSITENTKPEIDVYRACEWTAVGLLSELSVTNNSRIMEMPNFRKNMPYSEQIIKL